MAQDERGSGDIDGRGGPAVGERDDGSATGHGLPPRAIVLGGHYVALAVVRALGKEGVRVLVVASDPDDHACHSKFVSDVVMAPDPSVDDAGLLESVLGIGQEWDGAFLIPSLDEYVLWVARNQTQLGRRFVFSAPGREVIDGIVDKSLLYAAAREAAIPMPDFLVPDSVESLEYWRASGRYPCILKPYESRRFSGIYGTKVLVADDFAELTEKYLDTRRHGLDVMVCEIIPGDDSTIFSYHCYIDSRGEVLAGLCTEKLRQYPPGFGQGSVVRTVPIIPEVRDSAIRLLRHVGYRGEASTEFRFDRRDNLYKLMEINTRPIVYERLLVDAGVNLPYLTYRDLMHDVRIAPSGCDTDLHWIHNHWEMVNFVRQLKSGHLHPRAFFAPYGKRRVMAVPFREDPAHYLREVLRYGGLAFKRMSERDPW
jgi:D-aspartate ligase